MKKTIIFDWHGVLDHASYQRLIAKMSKFSNLSFEEVKTKLNGKEHEYVKGAIEPDEFWNACSELFALSGGELEDVQKTTLSFNKNEELWFWLEDNKEKYDFAILSDCPKDKVEIIKQESDLSLFREVYLSVEWNITKYEFEFFQMLLDKLNLDPKDCIFVDDNEKHVDTAQKLGMQGVVFLDFNTFIKNLDQVI